MIDNLALYIAVHDFNAASLIASYKNEMNSSLNRSLYLYLSHNTQGKFV